MKLRFIFQIFAVATIVYAIKTKQSHGRFVGVPFEFRMPTIDRIRQRWWNPDDPRLFTEHAFGIGWSINLYQLREKLGMNEHSEEGENTE